MNTIQQFNALKQFKAEMKEQMMNARIHHANEKVRYANERALIAQEYADKLEALITEQYLAEHKTKMSEVNKQYTKQAIPAVARYETMEAIRNRETVEPEVAVIVPAEVPAELATEPEEIISVATPEPEPKKEINLRDEIIDFLMMTFVNTKQNINHTVPELYGLFGNKCGKNIFTKSLSEIGIKHYKSNGTIKYKYYCADLGMIVGPLWVAVEEAHGINEPKPVPEEQAEEQPEPVPEEQAEEQPEPVPEEQPEKLWSVEDDDNDEEQTPENNFWLACEAVATTKVLKSKYSTKSQKLEDGVTKFSKNTD